MAESARRQRPTWINSQTTRQGFVQLGDKKYSTDADQFRYDEDSERNVLGGILVAGDTGNGRKAMQRVGFIHYDDFFLWGNGIIFRAMERIYARMQPESRRALADMTWWGLPAFWRVNPSDALVLSTARDVLISPALAESTARLLGAEYRVLDGIGHALMLDARWERAAEALAGWIEERGL